MTIQELLKQGAKQEEATATKRIYADIRADVDAGLERLAVAAKKTKKGMIEHLILEAVCEFEVIEAETSKRAKKGRK